MERYTFDEVRSFKSGDVFWAKNDKFVVNSETTYHSTSDFYGDHSEKLEWTAISETTHAQSSFQVTHTKDQSNPSDPIIFKIATDETMIAGAGKRVE